MVGEKRLHRSRAYYGRKCKTVRGTNIDSLPDELLVEILASLPAEDLHHRARVVCRRWRHLIHSDHFIKTQLHRSTYGLVFSLFDHPSFVTATQDRMEKSTISDKFPTYSRLRSSCNGLGLQHHDGNPVSIMNPVTGQQFDLPPFSSKKMIHVGCGIGYAADSMEYKVVQPYMTVKEQIFLGILETCWG